MISRFASVSALLDKVNGMVLTYYLPASPGVTPDRPGGGIHDRLLGVMTGVHQAKSPFFPVDFGTIACLYVELMFSSIGLQGPGLFTAPPVSQCSI